MDGQKATVVYDHHAPEKISVEPGSSNDPDLIGILVNEIMPLKEKLDRQERMSEN
jgi:hypothetical protein